jgi:hypothetical protein
MPNGADLSHDEIDSLKNVIVEQAVNSDLGPGVFMRDLIRRTQWPPYWIAQRVGALRNNPPYDARELIQWAIAKGGNPEDPRFTTLGSFLHTMLSEGALEVGLEDARFLVALILGHRLYRDATLRSGLRVRFYVPFHSAQIGGEGVEFGPSIDWEQPAEEVELQAFARKAPDFHDVGFLKIAIERASAACRVEFEHLPMRGTGFYIGKNQNGNSLVLTNYHVLVQDPEQVVDGDTLNENARQAKLLFGKISKPGGGEAEGRLFKLVGNKPVLEYSSAKELDFVLLEADETIQFSEEIQPVPLTTELPYRGMGLNILQHPGGKELKLALSPDGVEQVIQEKGYVLYSTQARSGSSGSPCFTDDWDVIALHHAQRLKVFGSIRRGILMQAIYPHIEKHLI